MKRRIIFLLEILVVIGFLGICTFVYGYEQSEETIREVCGEIEKHKHTIIVDKTQYLIQHEHEICKNSNRHSTIIDPRFHSQLLMAGLIKYLDKVKDNPTLFDVLNGNLKQL